MSKTHEKIDQITDKAHELSERVADKAEKAIDTARDKANAVLDEADVQVRTLREDVQPAIDAISSRVHDMAHTARVKANEAACRSREKLHHMSQCTSDYVQEQPLKAMALAAAAGAVVALLLGRRR